LSESQQHTSGPESNGAPGSARYAMSGRGRLILAVTCATVWWLALVTMATVTSNPVTLNREQIDRATFVVGGTVQDLGRGIVSVKREWKQNKPLEQINVDNLAPAGAEAGEEYLMPLVQTDGESYHVVEVRVPGTLPVIYPLVPEASEQLQIILK